MRGGRDEFGFGSRGLPLSQPFRHHPWLPQPAVMPVGFTHSTQTACGVANCACLGRAPSGLTLDIEVAPCWLPALAEPHALFRPARTVQSPVQIPCLYFTRGPLSPLCRCAVGRCGWVLPNWGNLISLIGERSPALRRAAERAPARWAKYAGTWCTHGHVIYNKAVALPLEHAKAGHRTHWR